ncbi:hypothetical protein WOSG25_210130 [Weissella oryzae SG25]|uniref:Uncharacterized protein n=1 Tax=Weissella oryzae (strain DSM 25784 / JCM 18191 / LMG 30913 / SG25) TaxID=1329250 RepID=A0A069D3I7_WEIOS|nr:hypothetical protein [Weissella oryzae]GAK31956.1 hypothetical protein WOSG25_210130 [Weissella oryzae SG25]
MKIKLTDMYGEKTQISYGLFEQFITDFESVFFTINFGGRDFTFDGREKRENKDPFFKYPFGVNIIDFSMWLSKFDFNKLKLFKEDGQINEEKLEDTVFQSMYEYASEYEMIY